MRSIGHARTLLAAALATGALAACASIATMSPSLAQAPGARPMVTQQQGLDLNRPSSGDDTMGQAPSSHYGDPRPEQRPDSCWLAHDDSGLGYWGSCSEPRARRRDNRNY